MKTDTNVLLSNASNTIHIDDLVGIFDLHLFTNDALQSRNFALNPRQGLKISPFRNARTPEAVADRELYKITQYLLHLAQVADLRTVMHKVGSQLFVFSCAHAQQNWKHVIKMLAGSRI